MPTDEARAERRRTSVVGGVIGRSASAPVQGWLRVSIRRCRPARFQNLFGSREWSYLEVDAWVENPGRTPVRVPDGEDAVLVDGVGYAYRDVRRLRGEVVLGPGKGRLVRYLFKVPPSCLIGKLRLEEPVQLRAAETGLVDLRVNPRDGA